MVQLRRAAHTMADLELPSGEVLGKLDRMAANLPSGSLATCIAAVILPWPGTRPRWIPWTYPTSGTKRAPYSFTNHPQPGTTVIRSSSRSTASTLPAVVRAMPNSCMSAVTPGTRSPGRVHRQRAAV